MKIRFQADADLNQKIVSATIRLQADVDFRTATAAGLEGIDDLGVLEIAASDSRVLVTHDKSTMPTHFAEFVARKQSPGVLLARRGVKLSKVAEELVLIAEASEAEEWINRIAYIPL